MTTKSKPRPLAPLLAGPRAFVSRLILADLLAKRGEGPLGPRRIAYQQKKD